MRGFWQCSGVDLTTVSDPVFLQQAIERAAADAERPGGAGLVAAVSAIGVDDVLARERVEIDVAGCGNHRPFVGGGDDLGRQILDVDVVVVGENLRAIDRILKLPHVAGPTVPLEDRNHVGIDLPIAAGKVFDQQPQVAGTLSQRRQIERRAR